MCGKSGEKTGLNLCNKARQRYSQKSRKSHKCHRRSGDGSREPVSTMISLHLHHTQVFRRDSPVAAIFCMFWELPIPGRWNYSINKHHDWLVKTWPKIGTDGGKIRRRDISCVGCSAGQMPPAERKGQSWPICNKYPHQRQIDTMAGLHVNEQNPTFHKPIIQLSRLKLIYLFIPTTTLMTHLGFLQPGGFDGLAEHRVTSSQGGNRGPRTEN